MRPAHPRQKPSPNALARLCCNQTGPSTDADSLQKMAEDHPIVETLLRYREVEKLRGTYADALPPLVGPDGRCAFTLEGVTN